MNIGNQHRQDGATLDGEDQWPLFFLRFTYEGKTYDLDFFAPSQYHAERMVDAIKGTAQYEGKLRKAPTTSFKDSDYII